MTPKEQLAQLDAAIQAVMATGQEYKNEGMWLRRADLAVLIKQRNLLAAEVARLEGGTSVAEFEGR